MHSWIEVLSLGHLVFLSAALFLMGLSGLVLFSKNLVKLLISLEIMALGVHVLFVSLSSFSAQVEGQVLSLFVLAVSAVEAALGLALLVAFYRKTQSVHSQQMTALKG